MNLESNYLGLKLRSPLVCSASPLTEDVENLRKMEDAGAGAIVLSSLFEEQIKEERLRLNESMLEGTESFAEALSYFPEPESYHKGTDDYLDRIRKAKRAVDIPVIASLNGDSIGGWTDFASQMEQAGADALELNVYYIPTDMELSGAEVEQTYIDILKAVKGAISIPVAVKVSPFFSSTANMLKQLDDAGADGLVLFNRFYQPDIDLETLEIVPNVLLSTPAALRLPLRWIAILYGRLQADLAATSGVHAGEDAIKVIMAGAKVAMMTSALLRHGIEHLRVIENGVVEWMQQHEYESIEQMRGSMSQMHSEDPSAFERAQYRRAITTFRHKAPRL